MLARFTVDTALDIHAVRLLDQVRTYEVGTDRRKIVKRIASS
jgi:hypothetical protein